jgi:hypothetical protein
MTHHVYNHLILLFIANHKQFKQPTLSPTKLVYNSKNKPFELKIVMLG